jgi:hypothetical protein
MSAWNDEVNVFVQRRLQRGEVFEALSDAPWIDAFEAKLPFRLPPSYRALVVRYRFAPFHARGIELFANRGADADDELVRASTRDSVLVAVLWKHGLLQVGRPVNGTYDPVCFDMSRRSKAGEAPLVCLDHEEILVRERIRVVRQHAGSFQELLAETA